MNQKVTVLGALAACVALCLGVLSWWMGLAPAAGLRMSVPGMDDPDGRKAADAMRRVSQVFEYGEIFQVFRTPPAAVSGSWPRFRGPNLDGISPQDTRLADGFPAEGPREARDEGHRLPLSPFTFHQSHPATYDVRPATCPSSHTFAAAAPIRKTSAMYHSQRMKSRAAPMLASIE